MLKQHQINFYILFNKMENSTTVVSPSMVNEVCSSACKSMKMLSKQMMIMDSTYSKIPNADIKLYDQLSSIMESINDIQSTLTSIGHEMSETIETKCEDICIPDSTIVTTREYNFLNSVFNEYVEHVQTTIQDEETTSGSYSIFSPHSLYDFSPLQNNDRSTKTNRE